jgi:hydrogenase expression/formation protein HypE
MNMGPQNLVPGRRRLHPRKLDLRSGAITLAHGAGGRLTAQLIDELIKPAFANAALDAGDDQARLAVPAGRLVVSTDGFVVSPLEFAGGDIGTLAVHGTLNDIAMAGAVPLSLTCGLILEEGLPLSTLERIIASMARCAREAGVPIVTGDTKVVERGKGDGIFITTTGIGMIPDGLAEPPACTRARPGDAVLVSGFLGDHGTAILAARGELPLQVPVASDSAALHGLVAAMLAAVPGVRTLRDPTRGGLSAALNEIAWSSGVGFVIEEAALPIRPAVDAACELLGLDPLTLANEGKLLAICPREDAAALLAAMKAHPLGHDAAIIGSVTADPQCFVQLATTTGGRRMIDWLAGDALPRIC